MFIFVYAYIELAAKTQQNHLQPDRPTSGSSIIVDLEGISCCGTSLGCGTGEQSKKLGCLGMFGVYILYNYSGWWFQTFFCFAPFSKLTNIFQMGWNHQLVCNICMFIFIQQVSGDLAGPLPFSSAYLHKISPQKKKARAVPRVTSILMPLGLEIKSVVRCAGLVGWIMVRGSKLRDNSLDIDSFSKQVEHRVGMVAEKTWFEGKMFGVCLVCSGQLRSMSFLENVWIGILCLSPFGR